jgi:Ca2+-binding EF-hand superfamily protein
MNNQMMNQMVVMNNQIMNLIVNNMKNLGMNSLKNNQRNNRAKTKNNNFQMNYNKNPQNPKINSKEKNMSIPNKNNNSNSILKNNINNQGNKNNILNNKQNDREGKLSNEELKELKEAFDAFDSEGKGKINIKEVIESMKSLEFDKKNPIIFKILCELDTEDVQKKGGITFDEFIEAIEKKLYDRDSKEGIKNTFNLMISDPNRNVINFNDLKKLSEELGENMSDEEIKDMLKNASKNGTYLTFEEFYEIMKKK